MEKNLMLILSIPLFLIFFGVESLSAQSSKAARNETQISENVEKEYTSGLKAFKDQNWARAIIRFENVLKMDKNYLDTRQKLKAAKWNLEQSSMKIILADYYAKGKEAMDKNELQAAREIFEKVNKINSNYRNTNSLLLKIAEEIEKIELDSLYEQALSLLKAKNWKLAILGLKEVQILKPSYKDVADRLLEARAMQEIADTTKARMMELEASDENRDSIFQYSTFMLVALGVIALIGILFLFRRALPLPLPQRMLVAKNNVFAANKSAADEPKFEINSEIESELDKISSRVDQANLQEPRDEEDQRKASDRNSKIFEAKLNNLKQEPDDQVRIAKLVKLVLESNSSSELP